MKKLIGFVMLLILFQMSSGYENNGMEKMNIMEEIIEEGSTNYLMKANYPIIPYYVKVYRFPAGTKIKVNVTVEQVKEKEGEIRYAPPIKADGFYNIEIKNDANFEVYPEKWYDYSIGIGRDGENIWTFLTIYLYKERIINKKIFEAIKFNVKIEYTLPSHSLIKKDAYDLLIICPQKWVDAIQPFKEHKERHGIRTLIMEVENIYANYNARDDAEKVKYFIKDVIENYGIKYVLLVGGRKFGIKERWHVPVRYAHLDDGSRWESRYLSDLYYADVYRYEDGIAFEDWDSNGNGIFAEWWLKGRDYIDLYPDVYVGRWAARNKIEVKIMVDKTINYENKKFDEFYKFIMVAGDSYNDTHGYIEGEMATWEAYKYMEGFEAVKVWASEVSLNARNIRNAMNGGGGFAYFCGHGNPFSWSTHKPYTFDEWEDGFQIFDMPFLKNGCKLPIVVIGGCHNSQFNVTIFNTFNKEKVWKGENAPECWSWWLTRKIGGGAIATIGNTGLGYHGSEDSNNDGIADYLQILDGWLEINFFRLYNEGINVLGELHSKTLEGFINTFPGDEKMPLKDRIDCKVVEEWLLLGDPSLKIGGYE